MIIALYGNTSTVINLVVNNLCEYNKYKEVKSAEKLDSPKGNIVVPGITLSKDIKIIKKLKGISIKAIDTRKKVELPEGLKLFYDWDGIIIYDGDKEKFNINMENVLRGYIKSVKCKT